MALSKLHIFWGYDKFIHRLFCEHLIINYTSPSKSPLQKYIDRIFYEHPIPIEALDTRWRSHGGYLSFENILQMFSAPEAEQ